MNGPGRVHAAEQALDYLRGMRADVGSETAFSATVCDGRQWGFLVQDEGLPSLFEPEVGPEQRFDWRPNSPAACRRFLELIGTFRQASVTPAALRASFGASSTLARSLVALLVDALRGRAAGDRADVLFREWSRTMDVVYGSLADGEGRLAGYIVSSYVLRPGATLGELLFVLHTYFSLVSRLIACEVLALSSGDRESQPSSWSTIDDGALVRQLSRFDRGEIPPAISIENLFESDVFSWYREPLAGNIDLVGGIRQLLRQLGEFAFPRVAYGANPTTDLLRDLYQSLVPRPLRRFLGEFLTPAWLAEASLDGLRLLGADFGTAKVLDPTCGTGTFLLPVLRDRIRQLRSQSGTPTVGAIASVLNSIAGVDINPVAVIAARVNVVTALGDLAAVGSLTLPIWRADSILLPEGPVGQGSISGPPRLLGRPWRALHTSIGPPFPVPPSLATSARMPELRRILETALEEPTAELGQGVFRAAIYQQFGPSGADPVELGDAGWTDVEEVAVELYVRLRELKDSDRNGVWAGIIENSFAPLFIGQFDVVVGNPPWLTWTRLPAEWRARSEASWKRYGLWRIPAEGGRQARSLASTDLASLVLAVASDRYLRPGGLIGLLMPKSIITADPGNRAIRRFRLRPDSQDSGQFPVDVEEIDLRPLHLDDWASIQPFSPEAANQPVFLALRKGSKAAYPVPTTQWRRAEARGHLSGQWTHVRPALRPAEGESNPVTRAVSNSAWSFQAEGAPPLLEGGANSWEFGKGLDTRGANGIFFVRIRRRRPATNEVEIENLPLQGRDRRRVTALRGAVASELVYPLVRGRDVTYWRAVPSMYIVAPYEPGDLGRLLPEEELVDRFLSTRNWLGRFREILAGRRPPPNRNWHMEASDWYRLDGPIIHMGGEAIVVVRELQARPAAAVLAKRFDAVLGRSTLPLIDHKLLFCAVGSADEAAYLAGMINSTPMQDLLASFANQIAVSPQTLARLPIPPFDSGGAAVCEAASALAADVAETGQTTTDHQDALDAAVLSRLGVTEAWLPQPTARRRSRRRPEVGPSAGEQEPLPLA